MAVRNGVTIAVGDTADIKQFADPATKAVYVKRSAVLPGWLTAMGM